MIYILLQPNYNQLQGCLQWFTINYNPITTQSQPTTMVFTMLYNRIQSIYNYLQLFTMTFTSITMIYNLLQPNYNQLQWQLQ
jgi:hypothetical protein